MASGPSFTPCTGLGTPARSNAVRNRSTQFESSSINNTLPAAVLHFDFSPPRASRGNLPYGRCHSAACELAVPCPENPGLSGLFSRRPGIQVRTRTNDQQWQTEPHPPERQSKSLPPKPRNFHLLSSVLDTPNWHGICVVGAWYRDGTHHCQEASAAPTRPLFFAPYLVPLPLRCWQGV